MQDHPALWQSQKEMTAEIFIYRILRIWMNKCFIQGHLGSTSRYLLQDASRYIRKFQKLLLRNHYFLSQRKASGRARSSVLTSSWKNITIYPSTVIAVEILFLQLFKSILVRQLYRKQHFSPWNYVPDLAERNMVTHNFNWNTVEQFPSEKVRVNLRCPYSYKETSLTWISIFSLSSHHLSRCKKGFQLHKSNN